MAGGPKRLMKKLFSAVFMFRQLFFVFCMMLVMQPTSLIFAQQAPSQPQAVSASSSCQWTYYPISGGKLQPEQLLYNDPDNTPVENLSLGSMFKGKSTHLASTGSTDFNGDNKTDVFRTLPRPDGNLQWQYSSGGTGAWQNLAYATSLLPTSLLQFGDFNSDHNTDVFANVYNNGSLNYQWLYSSGGTGSFITLNSTSFPPARLALGDFNGDGVTDVFTATASSNTYQWAYSPGGTGSLTNLAYSSVDPSLLRFGDFNGDGITDVFAGIQQLDGSTQWVYSSGGAASFTNLITTTVPYSELQFGDFNGDGTTDVLAADPQSDGSLNVVYWPGGLGAGLSLGHIPAPAPALRVGDFNGDGISDLMALRCGMAGPLASAPLETLATSGYNTFQYSLAGDVNGDGLEDVLLVSTCQTPSSFGTCATHHLQVGAALGAPGHTYTLVAPQQLGDNTLDFTYYKFLTGDFNGDGKTDLALVYPDPTSLTIYIAQSNGNGSFTLESPQTFTGEAWNNFNPLAGDFNGDGKTDLGFTTVCNFATTSCSVGDNNSLYVATSSGGVFTMGARQNLSASGWTDYMVFAGDLNSDGKTDLVFNSTCQKTNFIDSSCTIGDANLVYTALNNGLGSFSLSSLQTYGASGWSDYPNSIDLVGDMNGDGRSDLVWTSHYQSGPQTHNQLVVVGLANLNGTFQLGSVQNFGSAWSGGLSLADLNHDGKADLVWNNAPYNNTDVDTYAAATSNGNGSFTSLGSGAVFTGEGYFQLLATQGSGKIAAGLTLISTRQDAISNALFVEDLSLLDKKIYVPMIRK